MVRVLCYIVNVFLFDKASSLIIIHRIMIHKLIDNDMMIVYILCECVFVIDIGIISLIEYLF